MSIPIAARRYISELGLNNFIWVSGKLKPCGSEGDHRLVVARRKINELFVFSAFWNGSSWVTWNPEAGYCEVENIVCWSEIKI